MRAEVTYGRMRSRIDLLLQPAPEAKTNGRFM